MNIFLKNVKLFVQNNDDFFFGIFLKQYEIEKLLCLFSVHVVSFFVFLQILYYYLLFELKISSMYLFYSVWISRGIIPILRVIVLSEWIVLYFFIYIFFNALSLLIIVPWFIQLLCYLLNKCKLCSMLFYFSFSSVSFRIHVPTSWCPC